MQLEVVGDIANAVWQLKNALQQQQHWNYSFMMQVWNTELHDCVQLSQEKEHLWLLASGTGTMKLCICWNFEVLSTELFQKFLEV
jgi:hypothetical protein